MALFNSFAHFKRSGGWTARHRAIDYATPKNTVARAAGAGRYYRMRSQLNRRDVSAAGHWGYLLLANGDRIYICHLTKHLARNGAKVVKGQALARTGNSGYVLPNPIKTGNPDSGQHMHTYGAHRSGARFDWTDGAEDAATGRVDTRKGLRLRTRPTTVLSRTLAILPEGTKVTAISFNGKWWKVRVNGKTGWIHAGYLR